MAKTHPYILPGYELIEIEPYDVEPTSTIVAIATVDSLTEIEVQAGIDTDDRGPKTGTALVTTPAIFIPAIHGNIGKQLVPGGHPISGQNEDNETQAEIFTSVNNVDEDRVTIKKKGVKAGILALGILTAFGVYAFGARDLGAKITAPMTTDRASATPVRVINGIPANIAPLLDVYYQPQPLLTDRVITEKDTNGCEWKVAFDGSVNIPKGRYPLLSAQNVQKCTDPNRTARPEIVRVPRGSEPKGPAGTNIAIVNVIDPATGLTDRRAFAAFKGVLGENGAEASVDKQAIDAIVKSEIARAQHSGAAIPRQQRMASRSMATTIFNRYPGIEYGNRQPISAMPSMPGNTSAHDDRPTYIPYIPGVPYNPPASLGGGPRPLHSIRPKTITGRADEHQTALQIQSARPGGKPTELRQAIQPPPNVSGPSATPSGSPIHRG